MGCPLSLEKSQLSRTDGSQPITTDYRLPQKKSKDADHSGEEGDDWQQYTRAGKATAGQCGRRLR